MKALIEKLLNRKAEADHLKTGRWGEQKAVRLLRCKRYKIVGRRVRVGEHDEIDIIAEHRGTLIFVEVKTRADERYGAPASSVDAGKQKHLSRAAVTYLKRNRKQPRYIRFDVIEVVGKRNQGNPEIRHIENAFPLDSAYRLWW